MILITAGIIAAISASTATTIATVTGVGVATAAVVTTVANIVEEENYKKVQQAKTKAKNKISSTQKKCDETKNKVKTETLSKIKSDIENSNLSKNSKKRIINQINLPDKRRFYF